MERTAGASRRPDPRSAPAPPRHKGPRRGPRPPRSGKWPTTCFCATTARSASSTASEAAGLVFRMRDEQDHRVVRLYLTEMGRDRLEELSALHLEELGRLALDLPAAWKGLAPVQRVHGFPGSASPVDEPAASASVVDVARVYDTERRGGYAVLVDRLWPRGVRKEQAPFEEWSREVAPSPGAPQVVRARPRALRGVRAPLP